MKYSVRPISDRTWLGTMGKEPTRFTAKWSDTLDLLGREVDALDGRNVVLEIDIEEKDLKLNGELRANARPSSQAVAVAFESKHGPLYYRCDRFVANYYHQGPAWQHNVRAIARTLESLRAVDRYGATETGQQYAGFKAIGAGSKGGFADRGAAMQWLLLQAGLDKIPPQGIKTMMRMAARKSHPDHGGSRSDWDKFKEARNLLIADGVL